MSEDYGFFRNLGSLANTWVSHKKKQLQAATPETLIDKQGGFSSYEFNGQTISQGDLRDIKKIRESGGVISQVVHTKALIKFGAGVELYAEDSATEEWLQDELDGLDNLVLDLGEDAIWYPYAPAETVPTQANGFSHIECIEPWTILPQTNEFGEIIAWEQRVGSQFEGKAFDPDDIGHIVLNKASGRDKTGISEVLRNEDEVEAFKSNHQSIQEVMRRMGHPWRHTKVGREGAAQLNDTELRRIRNRTKDIGPGENLTTGKDVDIEENDPPEYGFRELQEYNMKMLATAFGLPVELVNVGSDGLGSGMPAELRKELLALQNEADRRRFADQFTEQFLRPIIRDYTDFDHTQDMGIRIKPFLDDKVDMAEMIQKVGDYLTANEVRSKLDYEELEDDELGDSFRTPADIETPEEEQDDGLPFFNEREMQEIGDIDTTPPESVQEQAQMALDWREETGNPNDCGTQTGWQRANQLANRESLSEETINRMVSFFARHDSGSGEDKENCSRMMWKAWGGDPGKRWAESKQEEFENARENAAGDTDFRHSCGLALSDIETDGWDEWEHTLYQLQHGAYEVESDKRLNTFSERAIPDFVRERLRDSILSGAVFSQFETIADNDLMQLREFLIEELTEHDGWTMDSIAGRLQDLQPELTKNEAERIARTETNSIVNTAREDGYEETDLVDGEKFYWVGSVDDRTTDACKWLIGGASEADNIGGSFKGTNPNFGGEPRSLDKLKELIQEANRKDPEIDHDAREFTPHISCRKTWVRAVE